MRKSTILLVGLVGFSSWALAMETDIIELPANFDAWNLNFKMPLDKLKAPENATPAVRPQSKPGLMRNVRKEAAAKQYTVAAQTYHSSYVFNYEGGDVKTYSIGIAVDGDQVTISNFFNLEAQSTEWAVGVDYDVVGTYDATAKTITIPTSTNFDNATVAGTIGTYYTEVLACGEVTEDGKLAPADELVFNVIGDFEAIETDMSFGIINYTNDGSFSYGTQTLYRRFYAQLPSDEPKLMCFNESFNLGETFPNVASEGKFTVINVSGVDVDFSVEMESDDDTYTANPDAGTIGAGEMLDINVSFLPTEPGDYEGMAILEYDGNETTPEPITVLYEATAIPQPDFTPAVKSGDFTFETNIEFPFEITTIEDGTTVARSTTNGLYGTSKLNVEFDVPEGNIGVFAWKGKSVNTGYWYHNAGGYFIDNAGEPEMKYTGADDDISGNIEFAPGKHSVRFQYEGLYYTGVEANGLYVYDLELVNTPAEADAVFVETPEVNLGNFMIKDENGIDAQGVIVLRNKGTNELTVNGVTSSNGNFTATVPSSKPALLETVEIPVIFKADEAGEYVAEFTIETSAGIVKANVKALVRKMADFSTVVTEGAEYITGFSTNESFPFEVENGVAYNANSGEADEVASTSWFQIDITIPEGKAGYISWDGIQYPDMPDEVNYWIGDYSQIYIQHPMISGTLGFYPNETSVGSDDFAAKWGDSYMTCIPGNHTIQFSFLKNGDGSISEKDRVEISNFKIRVEDFKENDAEFATDQAIFEEPIYVGNNRYLTKTIKVKNTGSKPLEILGCTADHPFYGVYYEGAQTQWNNETEVGIWFYPSEEGEFEGTVTFNTTAGDFDVFCSGSTKEAEGILLIGDVENKGDGWSFYDADRDGLCWDLGYNLWGLNPQWVHEGDECFGSASYDPYSGGIEPDNWLFSPIVGIPEDGAMLRWYAASHHHDRYAENYSVYVATPEVAYDIESLSQQEPVFTETLTAESADIWQERVVDLAEFAEEDVVVVFRHHGCNGQYVLKIDDIFVYDMQKWNGMTTGANKVEGASDVVSTEIYDINGLRLNTLKPGINIVRRTHADGSVKTSKIIVK